ncbi:hypothetical protein HYQ44_004822 [Verticillium longisporum]|nr:hypothetical protein HYQ44_004822 [Verticillium longisporum]
MHAQFSAMALEAVICKVELYAGMPWVPSWVSWIEAASGICSSAMAFGATWAPHQITVQCLACTLVISGKAFRDWLASHDGLNPPWYERPECSISEIQNDLVETAKSPKPPVSQSLGTNIELNPAHTTHSQSIPESFDAELPATPDLALNNGIVCVRTIEHSKRSPTTSNRRRDWCVGIMPARMMAASRNKGVLATFTWKRWEGVGRQLSHVDAYNMTWNVLKDSTPLGDAEVAH